MLQFSVLSITAQILLVLEKWCFYDFFSKILDLKKIKRTSISHQFSGVLAGYNQKLQIWSPSMTAEIFLVFEMWHFL